MPQVLRDKVSLRARALLLKAPEMTSTDLNKKSIARWKNTLFTSLTLRTPELQRLMPIQVLIV